MASSLMVDGRLRTVSKCSAQRSRSFSLSEISVVPSALRRGADPDDVGPYTALSALQKFFMSLLSA